MNDVENQLKYSKTSNVICVFFSKMNYIITCISESCSGAGGTCRSECLEGETAVAPSDCDPLICCL